MYHHGRFHHCRGLHARLASSESSQTLFGSGLHIGWEYGPQSERINQLKNKYVCLPMDILALARELRLANNEQIEQRLAPTDTGPRCVEHKLKRNIPVSSPWLQPKWSNVTFTTRGQRTSFRVQGRGVGAAQPNKVYCSSMTETQQKQTEHNYIESYVLGEGFWKHNYAYR